MIILKQYLLIGIALATFDIVFQIYYVLRYGSDDSNIKKSIFIRAISYLVAWPFYMISFLVVLITSIYLKIKKVKLPKQKGE